MEVESGGGDGGGDGGGGAIQSERMVLHEEGFAVVTVELAHVYFAWNAVAE